MLNKVKKEKVYVKEKIYIPEKLIKKELLKNWEHHQFDDSMCRICDNRFQRPNDQCKPCKGYIRLIKLWNTFQGQNGVLYYTFPCGNVRRTLNKLNIDYYFIDIEDHRCTAPFTSDLKFTGQLYEGNPVNGVPTCNQKHLVNTWMNTKSGIIIAQPRSGKCCKSATIKTSEGIYLLDKLVKEKPLNVKVSTHSGMKDVSAFHEKQSTTIKIKSSYGYEIEGTPEHPVLILTPEMQLEWKRLDEVREGDPFCVYKQDEDWGAKDFDLTQINLYKSNLNASNLKALNKTPSKMNCELAELLGYLIANGGNSILDSKNEPYFITVSSKNQKIHERISTICKNLFDLEIKIKLGRNGTPCSFVYSKALRFFLEQCGLAPVKSNEKEIPFTVLRSSRESLIAFLSAYFTCDCYIPGKEVAQIELCSASEKLMGQIHVILTYFGIIGKFEAKENYARNTEEQIRRMYYHIRLSDKYREKFVKLFTLNKPYKQPSNKQNKGDTIPFAGDYFKKVVCKYHYGAGKFKINGKWKVLKLLKSSRMKADPSQSTLDYLNKEACLEVSPEFQNLFNIIDASEYIFFDKIISIEVKSELVDVYDLTVPEGHNFVANGVIVHNTVMGTNISCELGVKTLIVAHQEDLLNNFYKTYETMTNLKEVREITGKEIVKIVDGIEDLEQDLDVALINYQKFIRKETASTRIETYLKGKFGLLILDECFPAATKISLSNNTRIPIADVIQDLEKGFKVHVKTFNENTQNIEFKEIVKGFKKLRNSYLLKIKHQYGELICTADHQLFTEKGWVEAKHTLGLNLIWLDGSIGWRLIISQVLNLSLEIKQDYFVYDLEVKDNHNFFAENILVHNCHSGNATAYGKFLSVLDAKYRLGLTATPKRKDCLSGNVKVVTEIGELSLMEIILKLKKGEKIKVASFNHLTKQIEFKEILKFHEVKKDEFIEMTFPNNEKIKVTLDHEFYNFENNTYTTLLN